jgi:hypothetical protein
MPCREMQEWLTLHNVTFDLTMTKKQLYELIKPFNNNNNRRYLIDDILQRHEHIVLRLPPYHCQYNTKIFFELHVSCCPISFYLFIFFINQCN